jgi:biopolymer transport protein ExbD
MPKLREIRKKPKLDMNPMVDMAFLLVTFFMMTTTFRAELPEEINIPSSRSEIKLPEKQLATITVSESGTVFFGIDNKFDRQKLLEKMSAEYQIQFDAQQREVFSLTSTVGVPIQDLPAFLDAKDQKEPFEQLGIPIGENGQLRSWIKNARATNPSLRFAINADGKIKYPIIHELFETLRELNITRFNLVTEKSENDAPRS